MTVSNFAHQYKIPTKLTTSKSAPTTTNFSKGLFTYKPNDSMDLDEVSLAQNARFERIGEYKTRRGLAKLCEPIGKAIAVTNYTTSYEMKNVAGLTTTVTTTSPIYSINLTVATSDATSYGVLRLALLDMEDNVVAVSCAKGLNTTPEDTEFVFKDRIEAGTYKLTLSTQDGGTQVFRVAVLTGTSTIMYHINTATAGEVTNLFEANIDGTKTVLFTFKTADSMTLYRMDEAGVVTAIRTLPSTVTKVRFSQNVNMIRYADGEEAPQLIDPTDWTYSSIPTEDLKTEVALNLKVSNILAGTQDNMIYFDAETTTQAVWTYPYGFTYAKSASYLTSATINEYVPDETTTTTIGKNTLTPLSSTKPIAELGLNDIIVDELDHYGKVTTISGSDVIVTSISHTALPINSYDKFDRDFRQNFPAIKTGDPLTAMFNLGGVVYFLTRRNKYYMYSQTADVWTQQASSAQHGTFSQESCVCDLNYAYYANDDGIYIFDGSSEASITQNTIQNTYDAIANKESIVLELYNNRLYVFYSQNGTYNDSCLVYNINLKLWESFDTGTTVSASIGRQTASNRLICGSSRFGQLYTYETQTNEYADLGAPICFDIETAYLHFGTPSQLHRITKWRPEFSTVENSYTIKCGYALDFTNDVKYAFSINLKNQNVLDEHYVWDNPPTYGNAVTPTKLTMIPQVNGQFRRIQIRYQHHASFEPVNFKSHTVCVETQRIR